jgi:virulence-associated protein VagC
MIDGRRLPLVMFPNGALMRCEVVPEDCVLVIEPEEQQESDFPAVIDQTQAIQEAESGNSA